MPNDIRLNCIMIYPTRKYRKAAYCSSRILLSVVINNT